MGFAWSSDPEGYYGGYHTKIPLSSGQVLWVGVDDGEEQGIYRPAILILTDPTTDMWDGEEYLGEWFKGAADDAGGKPIGPGGTEAFAMAGAALREVEGMLHPGDLIVVGGGYRTPLPHLRQISDPAGVHSGCGGTD